MNPSTAMHRLVKDLLFKFVIDVGHVCFHCKQPVTRKTFSIEHKVPWLDSQDPAKTFFDLENIAFSHMECNFRAAQNSRKIYASVKNRNAAAHQRELARWRTWPKERQQARRRKIYENHGV